MRPFPKITLFPKNKYLLGVELVLLSALCAWTVQPFVAPGPPPEAQADAARLEADVRALSTTFHPRSFDSYKLDLAADYIREELKKTGLRVEEQPVTVDGRTYRNVIAHAGPAAGPVTVIGAHYDSFDDTPGADDNASGVAGVLELARLLGKQPPTRAIDLVAFTLEEPPYFSSDKMGSAWHARMLKETNRPVALMMSLEMIGFFSDDFLSQEYLGIGLQFLYPNTGNFVAVVGNNESWRETRQVKRALLGVPGLNTRSITVTPKLPGVDFSDHRNYWAHGYPAVMVTDTAFLRNKQYHKQGDTAEKLDYVRMARVVSGVFSFARQPADDELG